MNTNPDGKSWHKGLHPGYQKGRWGAYKIGDKYGVFDNEGTWYAWCADWTTAKLETDFAFKYDLERLSQDAKDKLLAHVKYGWPKDAPRP